MTRTRKSTSKDLAQAVAQFAADKKAEDIVILDMRDIVNYCDYFVLCNGNTDRQAKAIAAGIDEGLAEMGVKLRYKQGMDAPSRRHAIGDAAENKGIWVLLDLGDVVVHIFEPDSREFYGLDHLWGDAKPVAVKLA